MLLKEHCFTWPPSRVGDIAAPPADVEDTVVRIQKCAKPQGLLRLTLRNRIRGEYEAALLVPEFLQEQTIFLILRKEKITLREVGELSVGELTLIEPIDLASQPEPAANWAEFFFSIHDAVQQWRGRLIIKRQRHGYIFKFAHSILLFFRLG
jgi:hypothetical protein